MLPCSGTHPRNGLLDRPASTNVESEKVCSTLRHTVRKDLT
ncbi:unnamed protein product [Tuwongella immobilis]|uniref:Uncharacterized protein n=1 Tax=Tuwongella immobilis TaxID=692036 RepID=A0A6C2YI02_9BACT|nr:unnamed protein product [Tuwongella immobilis]VTR97517.1 unnamed protein product [Tuwongella immobilis]